MQLDKKTIITWVILGVALIFSIIALASPKWNKVETADVTDVGLFSSCLMGTCETYTSENLPSKLKTARAFGVMMTVSLVLSIVFCGVSHLDEVKPDLSKTLHIIAVILAWWSVLSGIVTLSAFSSFVSSSFVGMKRTYGYAFALEIVATILATVGGVMMTMMKK